MLLKRGSSRFYGQDNDVTIDPLLISFFPDTNRKYRFKKIEEDPTWSLVKVMF